MNLFITQALSYVQEHGLITEIVAGCTRKINEVQARDGTFIGGVEVGTRRR